MAGCALTPGEAHEVRHRHLRFLQRETQVRESKSVRREGPRSQRAPDLRMGSFVKVRRHSSQNVI